VYVHVSQGVGVSGPALSANGRGTAPAERAQVRVYLVPREQGGWQAASPDWFELTSNEPAPQSPADPAPSASENPVDQPAASTLGMTTDPVKFKDRLGLRVTSVERGSPAQQAGLEEDDVIIAANQAALTGPGQLEELAQRGEPFSLIVADVRTGRAAQVEIRPSGRPSGDVAGLPKSAPTSAPRISLGISAEPVALGARTALKVVRVEPGSPAEKAGLESGDVIVAANGVAITGPEQLVSAVRKSGAALELTVRDSRTGRDTPVQVVLGGPTATVPLPQEPALPGTGSAATPWGAVTELVFHNDEFAVKVTEVNVGSPAARAGLRPGILILEANGKPVLHPNELNDALRSSGKTCRLTIVDPGTGRKNTVDINLGTGGL
jgi:S1-C subfamily serine protease